MAWVMTESAWRTRGFEDDNGQVFWCGREGLLFQSQWISGKGWGPLTRVKIVPIIGEEPK